VTDYHREAVRLLEVWSMLDQAAAELGLTVEQVDHLLDLGVLDDWAVRDLWRTWRGWVGG